MNRLTMLASFVLCLPLLAGPPHPMETRIRQSTPFGTHILPAVERSLVATEFERMETFEWRLGDANAKGDRGFTASLFYRKPAQIGNAPAWRTFRLRLSGGYRAGEAGGEPILTILNFHVEDAGVRLR